MNHAAPGYGTITPYLIVDDPERLLEWLAAVLDAKEELRVPDDRGRVQHAEVDIGGSKLMMGRRPEGMEEYRAAVYCYTPDCDATWARAVEAGATVHREPADQFYGDRNGTVYGPCGNHWTFATHRESLTPEQLQERMPGSDA